MVDKAKQNEMFGDKKKTGTLYYLTGSQVFQTMKNISESLSGRVGIFDLFAFSDDSYYWWHYYSVDRGIYFCSFAKNP